MFALHFMILYDTIPLNLLNLNETMKTLYIHEIS